MRGDAVTGPPHDDVGVPGKTPPAAAPGESRDGASEKPRTGAPGKWRDGAAGKPRGGAPGEFAERVLEVVERIPTGHVMAYGDIAEYLGEGGPRQVGRVMALWGGAVPWWRVIRADGSPPAGHESRALRHYRDEGTPLRGTRVDMRRARWHGDGRADSAGGSGPGPGTARGPG